MGAKPQIHTFALVAALEPDGEAAARELRELYGTLQKHRAPADAEQLKIADAAAGRRDFDALKRFIAAGIPLDDLAERQHARVGRIIGWRNASAVLPLMLTWLALAVASWAYYQQVTTKTDLVTQPFLVLWQGRFGDLSIPTFAETAMAAFVLLLAVLTLTIWARSAESAANRTIADVGLQADKALHALDRAVESNGVRAPDNAKEWAEAASLILSETQQMIKAAVRDTELVARKNAEITQSASEQLTQLQLRGEELLKGVGEETREVMLALQRKAEQTTTLVGQEATRVLQQAGEANRQLVEQQMKPLFEGFAQSLADYRRDQKTYSTSAAAVAGAASDLAGAAAGLASSVGAYTTIARSIDEKLATIGASQSEFSGRIATHSASITSAATSLNEVATLVTGDLKREIETLTQNVVKAGRSLAATERNLSATTGSLEAATRAMGSTAADLARAAASVEKAAKAISAGAGVSGRGFWSRLFGGR
ncbi:hypothetical protein ACFWYW_34355 [Nonomuraea sp. NPDC059023]|uniref:hypothetical protein n=1 Tax=unclassified Nonomuraea TaxID=2593643 RepID=UPI0036761DFC